MQEEEIAVIRRAMVKLYDMINRSLDVRGAQTGFTRYPAMVMERLRSMPGLSQSQLATMLNTTKQYIGRVVGQLEERGMVEAKTPFSDGRVRRLYVTELGRERQDAWRAESVENMKKAFSLLEEPEQERLQEAFRALYELLPKLDREDITLF